MNSRAAFLFAIVCLPAALPAASPSPSALAAAQTLAESASVPADRERLLGDIALAHARRGRKAEALAAGAALPPALRATVLLELAAHLPDPRGAAAAALVLEAQTARTLTTDWRKARISRLLAVAQARLGNFEAAEAMAQAVPDAEEKAFALRDVVGEVSGAGDVARARRLAGGMEDSRRYGTYRQKAAALATVARSLHSRGNAEDAATLLAQAELLLPKKPGWSDGEAIVAVAVAAHACGETAKAGELMIRAETLAQAITGPWKVRELASVAAGWRECRDAARADARLEEAARFLGSLSPTDRTVEAVFLARAWHAAGREGKAKAVLSGVLAEARQAGNTDAWRGPHVGALLAWTELFGDAAR